MGNKKENGKVVLLKEERGGKKEDDTSVKNRSGEEKGQEQEKDMFLISETAKLVGVESHVLRYWEEELKLPIRRNDLGHRYYTKEDVDQFKEIKKLKEQGLQLKAIRTVLTDSSLQVMVPLREHSQAARSVQEELAETGGREMQDKGARLQLLLHSLISQAVRENNEELTREIKETIMKEMDYQFRVQEEENEHREQLRIDREEEHYRKLDELIRQRSKKRLTAREKKEQKKQEEANAASGKEAKDAALREPSLRTKRKKHSFF